MFTVLHVILWRIFLYARLCVMCNVNDIVCNAGRVVMGGGAVAQLVRDILVREGGTSRAAATVLSATAAGRGVEIVC